MEELISIVLPVYNGEKYLRESIDSVLAQTYKNWELLIVDDCSTDSSAAIAKEYASKDRRIYYYRNENNLRLPRNLNKGFRLAKGDYLTWTSDDNKFKPMALEKMYDALKNNQDAQFVFASCRVINSEGEEIEYIMVDDKRKKQIVGHNVVGACFMYTRKAYEEVGEYNPDFTLVEDYDYWQRIYQYIKRAHKEFLKQISREDICMSIGGDNYCYNGVDRLGFFFIEVKNSNIIETCLEEF